ncbi:DUF418 domain-containing protein [Streptomyces halobius]|uniref:DUF418 domain-containing protein n=1 Tax=Streptomyces halobius TaxID=2879846 RepID=A0ABY4M1W4_9ACTN|nr:DUF418 domain-containing protein [Streptomyces halobius]UQA90869.1 DUF418 domain-containing protein [Streptomyces halobius]
MSEAVRTQAAAAAAAEGATGRAGGGARARLPLLDVLRGVAILGTLMSNVWIFAGPAAEWGLISGNAGISAGADASSPAGVAETVFRSLANGKFLSMLTMLFGVGLAIQFRSAAERGQPWPGRYKWRALFLFAEGTVHFVLVFAWDVLMGYAVVALLVAWLLTRSARAQRVTWIAMGGLHLAAMALLTAARLLASGGGTGGGPGADAVALYAEGGYAEQITFRLSHAVVLRVEPVLSFGLLVFLFLLGVRLFRAGAFQGDAAGRRIRRRLAAWGLGIGLPLNTVTVLGGSGFFLLERYAAAPVLAIGYLGLIGMVMDRLRRPGPLTSALTSVGRTALSCYVLQNALAMLACYGIGLGLASHWADRGPWWVMGLWAAICLVLVAGASLWLRRFEHGPLESVQKRLLRR